MAELTGVPELKNMELLVETFDSVNHVLQCVVILQEFDLVSTDDPFNVVTDLCQQGYESSTSAVLEAYFNLLRVEAGSSLKDAYSGAQIYIDEEYLVDKIEPDIFVASNKTVMAGFINPHDLFPWKYRCIKVRYHRAIDFDPLGELPEGYQALKLPGFYPGGVCFGWYSPALISGSDWVLKFGSFSGVPICLIPTHWLQTWTVYEGVDPGPFGYMFGLDIDHFSPSLPGDIDFNIHHPMYINRMDSEGWDLVETYEDMSDTPDKPLWGYNADQRPKFWLRAASIDHEVYDYGNYGLLVVKGWIPSAPVVWGVYESPAGGVGGGVPPFLPGLPVLLEHIGGPSGIVAVQSFPWSGMIDGSWYLNGVHRLE